MSLRPQLQISRLTLFFILALLSSAACKADQSGCIQTVLQRSADETAAFAEVESASSGGHSWSTLYPHSPLAAVLDHINRGEVSRTEGRQLLLNAAEQTLRGYGIEFERVTRTDGTQYIRILPRRVDNRSTIPHIFNRLAAGLQKYEPDFELVYDPAAISTSTTGTLASVRLRNGNLPPALRMSQTALITGSVRERSLGHEVIHAKINGDIYSGRLHAYQSLMLAEPPRARSILSRRPVLPPQNAPSPLYDQVMRLDELITFRFDLANSVRELARDISSGSPSQIQSARQAVANEVAGSANIINRAFVGSSLVEAVLVQYSLYGAQWGRFVTFRHKGSNYRARVVLGRDANKRYASVQIEELPGAFALRLDVVSFDFHLPIPENTTVRDSIPMVRI